MGRHCALTGTKVAFGHNVSHSNRKTPRRFQPNLQKVTLHSDALRRTLRLSVSTRALRSIQKRGGLDAFLLGTADSALPPEALKLKHQVKKARS
jgi:large subunit ribosomal protein L28